MRKVAASMGILLLAACGEKVINPPAAGTIIHVPAFEWHVMEPKDYIRAYENAGMVGPVRADLPEGRLLGFAGYLEDGTLVVVTPPPRYGDDEVTTTLGHEVLHLVLGEFHR